VLTDSTRQKSRARVRCRRGVQRPVLDLLARRAGELLAIITNAMSPRLMTHIHAHFAAYISVTGPQLTTMAVIGQTPDVTHTARQMRVTRQFLTAGVDKLAGAASS